MPSNTITASRRPSRVRHAAFIVTCFLQLPPTLWGFIIPSSSSSFTSASTRIPQELFAIQSGSTRKSDDQSASPRWKEKVEANRPFLGHVVPKDSTTRQRRKVRPQGQYLKNNNNNNNHVGAPRTPPLKILGGNFRGRKLLSPQVHLRPMMGKVREACFSTLLYFGLYEPPTGAASKSLCRHLDIFSGSGSVGLESLSRGATHCTFVDLAPQCCDTIRDNLELCKISSDQAAVVCADAMELLQDPVTALQKAGFPCNHGMNNNNNQNEDNNSDFYSHPLLLPYQIVTLCPPYEEIIYGDLIDAVCNSPLVSDDTIVLIEYPVELGCLPHVYDLKSGGKMIGLRNRRYGRTVVALYIINPTGKLDQADSRPEEFVSL